MNLPRLDRSLCFGATALFLALLPALAAADERPPAPIARDQAPPDPSQIAPPRRAPLLIAVDPPPPPPPLPPPPPPPPPQRIEPVVSWTPGNRSMSWAPAVAVGPSFLVTRDFVAGGFDISGGAHNFQDYDPNRLTDSTAAAVASLGLLALPKGALLGNELGVDFVSRIYFLSGDRSVMETVLRPVSRVLRADSRFSFPSVLGTIVPAVGIATLFEKEGVSPQISSFHGDYLAFLTRWSFDAHLIVLPKPVLLFVAAEPFVELFVPYSGAAPHGAFGANVNFGLSIVEK